MDQTPLKQVSLRRFRDEVAEIHETVEVSRRDHQGNIQVLGVWTPYMQDVPGSIELPVGPIGTPALDYQRSKVIRTPADVAAAVPAVRPFSKADQAGRKKR